MTAALLSGALFVSVCAALLAGFPVAFTLAGVSLFWALAASAFGLFDIALLAAFPQRIYAIMTNQVLVAVPLFVFMGVMLERAGIAEDMLEAMGRLFGRARGGLVFAVTLVGAMIAATTGIVGATVVTLGLLSLPVMLKRGYAPSFSAGAIVASGTLGQIIPPSIVLVVLGDQISAAYQNAQFARGVVAPDTVTVNDLFAGALFPGLVLVGLYLVYQAAKTHFSPDVAPSDENGRGVVMPDAPWRDALRVLVGPLALVVAVLGSILAGIATPREAAAVGAVGAILLAGHRLAPGRGGIILAGAGAALVMAVLAVAADLRFGRGSLSAPVLAALLLAAVLALSIGTALWRTVQARGEDGLSVLAGTGRRTLIITAMIFAIVIGAAMFSLVLRGFGGDRIIEALLTGLPGGTAGAVLAVMAAMFVLGFFLEVLEIMLIVVPVVAPVLLQMETGPEIAMSPVWLGVMMGLVLQTSFLTPPVGLALFYLRGVAPAAVTTVDIYRGAMPYVLMQLAVLVLVWFLPDLAMWLPGWLAGR